MRIACYSMEKKTRSLSTRLITIFIVILVASTCAVGAISYYLNRDMAIRLSGERALSIAQTIAGVIDPVKFQEVVDSGEMSAYWEAVKALADKVTESNQLKYQYVLYGYTNDSVLYFVEGMREGDEFEQLMLGDTDPIEYYDRVLDVFAGENVISNIYSADEWGSLVTGLAPILDADGTVIGVVGADISVDDVLNSTNSFGLMILLLVIAISVVVAVAITFYLRRSLGRPIAELTHVAKRIAKGEQDVSIQTQSLTEIGALADSFRDMIQSLKVQAHALKAISEGDLSVTIAPQSEKDVMGHAIADTVVNLNAMIGEINRLTEQVAEESRQMASSADGLAKGATSQASAVEQLSASISEIAIQTKQSSALAAKSATLANAVREDADLSFAQTEKLIGAVKDINRASDSIRHVMKMIEEIAFMTNILSLNASVEAAHAGEYGKGFAVVSKEVQNLAKKTSESAKETAALVMDTIDKTKLGVRLAEEVHGAMVKVVGNVVESDRVTGEIALSSREQSLAIEQINQGINQVAQVVQQNTHVAEKSATISRDMYEQSRTLAELITRFKTRRK